jgi:hypothetical protein
MSASTTHHRTVPWSAEAQLIDGLPALGDTATGKTAHKLYLAAWDKALAAIQAVSPANAELIRKRQPDYARAQAQRQESVRPR